MQTFSVIYESNQNQGGLYASSIVFADNCEYINNFKIQAICSVCNRKPKCLQKFPQIENLHLQIEDHIDSINIAEQQNSKLNENLFQKSFEFIQYNRKNKKNVLVHCIMGVSRTSAILTYYLMKKYQINFNMAYNYIKSVHKIAKMNKGFMQYLQVIDSSILYKPNL